MRDLCYQQDDLLQISTGQEFPEQHNNDEGGALEASAQPATATLDSFYHLVFCKFVVESSERNTRYRR